jgi:putative nucleotidyltransferase with HDIG domain
MAHPAADFLTAFGRALSLMGLYQDGHPARERAVDRAHDLLLRLQEVDSRPRFTFLGSDIVYAERPFRELKQWDWSERLARAGIQRLEFTGPVGREDLEAFLDDAHRMMNDEASSAELRQTRPTAIRFGTVDVHDGQEKPTREAPRTAALPYSLADEVDSIKWIHDELRDRGDLRLAEAEAIVRSLSVAMHGEQAFVIPLLHLKEYDQYTTTHSLNVSTLAMALAEYVGMGPAAVRALGTAGLLHDLGKVTIPDDILNKPGKLSDDERAVMNRHPVEGARRILEAEQFLDLAAVVAYEHHMRIDGGGYPAFRFSRRCHEGSDLVHICDVFDALRTNRPYRDAWPMERVLTYLEEGAGKEFDAGIVQAFVRMMREWGERTAEMTGVEQSVPTQ